MRYTVYNAAHEAMMSATDLRQAEQWLDTFGLETDYIVDAQTGEEVQR
jgi:hypothetical protein